MPSAKASVKNILNQLDIKINGTRDWDIQVHDEKFYSHVLAGGSLALGETYMDGWWSSKAPDRFLTKLLEAKIDQKINKFHLILPALKSKLLNLQKKSKAFQIGEKHYDIGNDLYKKMLDKRMIYSCGYWKNAKNLDKAQEAKLDLICKKMQIKPGMKILDIGCGWGGFLKFAAEKYKIRGIGITVSKEQAKLAKESCKGLPIKIKVQDYRDLDEKFDRIISVGMLEHVGYKNYKRYIRVVSRSLKPEGLFLLHTIGSEKTTKTNEPWYNKYIFPNYHLPSLKQITEATENFMIIEDIHNFGPDYDKTLMAWYTNFTKNWKALKGKYHERFYRMWAYYLLVSAATFRSRNSHLWQIVLSKGNNGKTYSSIR